MPGGWLEGWDAVESYGPDRDGLWACDSSESVAFWAYLEFYLANQPKRWLGVCFDF